jgi:hypothetical protein
LPHRRFKTITITAYFSVADGVVYVGSNEGTLYALNAFTGAQIWNYNTGGMIGSAPAVASGVVYMGSWDGNVYAIGTPIIQPSPSPTPTPPPPSQPATTPTPSPDPTLAIPEFQAPLITSILLAATLSLGVIYKVKHKANT